MRQYDHATSLLVAKAGTTKDGVSGLRIAELVSLDVADRPGVLHSVTGVFAEHGVSIRVAEQEGNGPDARLVFITHIARERDLQATLSDLRNLDAVREVQSMLRVISDEQ